jgi:hypothetical protein
MPVLDRLNARKPVSRFPESLSDVGDGWIKPRERDDGPDPQRRIPAPRGCQLSIFRAFPARPEAGLSRRKRRAAASGRYEYLESGRSITNNDQSISRTIAQGFD